MGELGDEWAWKSEDGEDSEGWSDELVYLASVGVDCVYVQGFIVLVAWHGWLPKKLDGRASGEAG